MSEHTKGPWMARQEYANRWAIESHEQGELPVCVAHVSTTVCEVGVSDDETSANARLITAAPELLEALEQAERKLKCGHEERADCVCFDCELLRTVRAAIAKAREGGR